MSIPSAQPPMGGYYAAPPSKSGGPWKALGIGCAALFLLALAAGVVVVRSVKNQMDHPSKNSAVGMIVTAGKAGIEGAVIRQAIVAYHDKNGHYPASLMILVQDGELDGKNLHNDLDDSPDPGHVSWQYVKPNEGAPGSTPVLKESYHVTIGNAPSHPGEIVITLDGRNQSNTVPPTVPSSRPPGQAQP